MNYDWEKSNALVIGKLYSGNVMQNEQVEQCSVISSPAAGR
jgi:hypothetical protein